MRVVVIGVGNTFRGDDGAGIEAVRRLRDLLPRDVEVLELDGDPAELIDAWQGAAVAYVVDTVRGDGLAGEVHRIEVGRDGDTSPLGARSHDSSHALGFGDAVQLARVLDRLPERLVLVGIAGATFDVGAPLSEPVRDAIGSVVATLAEEVSVACA